MVMYYFCSGIDGYGTGLADYIHITLHDIILRNDILS